MNVVLMPEAEDVLLDISKFIDSINTENSGSRWLDKFRLFLHSYAKSNVTYALCSNETFAADSLSCINYNGWIIAFRIEQDEFIIYQIVRGEIVI